MAENDLERTESPTPRRREEARQDGNVARSQDLTAAAALLLGVVLLYALGVHLLEVMKLNLEMMLSGANAENATRAGDVPALLAYAGRVVLGGVGPLLLAMMAVVLVVNFTQVGFVLSLKPLQPSWSKLSPLRGLRGLLDARGAVRLGMSLGKVAVVAAVAVQSIWADLPRVIALANLEVAAMLGAAGKLVFLLALKLGAVLLVLALIDYGLQRWNRERDLRMSKQEVKEELRRMEGDPLVKQRRARVARQLSLQRIKQAVPKADVVVTNPTHFAVALQYQSKSMRAPKVVAKGADFLAQRIREIAIAEGVPIVERRELARGLYYGVDIGQEIPPQFYGPVAEILAYVYRLARRDGRKTA